MGSQNVLKVHQATVPYLGILEQALLKELVRVGRAVIVNDRNEIIEGKPLKKKLLKYPPVAVR